MCLCTFKTRECSCQCFQHIPVRDTQRGKKVTLRFPLHPTPRMVLIFSLVHVRLGVCTEKGPHNRPQRSRQDQLQSASGSTWLCLSPILLGTSCGLSVASVKPSDAAAINMRQRVWVSDSCTVDQGHTVLALSGRATPKKANPVWVH